MTTISPEISFPVGVRALMPEAAKRRRALETQCVAVLEAGGFGEIILPIVDFVDPYRDIVEERALRRSYRFTDREGELISIRSDFTPMVARVLAPNVTTGSHLRVFYRGDVIRYEPSRLGLNREFFQIGAELLGDDSVEADVELISTAIEVARSCGVKPLVAYRDASLVKMLTATLGGDERETLIAALRTKHAGALSWFRDKLDAGTIGILTSLIDGALTPESLLEFATTREVGLRLMAIARGVMERTSLELSPLLDEVDDETSYYTGVAFDLFSTSGKSPLARGGRYDALYGSFGNASAAIGFTLSVDVIEDQPSVQEKA